MAAGAYTLQGLALKGSQTGMKPGVATRCRSWLVNADFNRQSD